MKQQLIFIMAIIITSSILGSLKSYAEPLSEDGSGFCFIARNYYKGTLCFSERPSSVSLQAPVEVTFNYPNRQATFTYNAMGIETKYACARGSLTGDGLHCHYHKDLVFRRLILGGVEDIKLNLPDLDSGSAVINGISYELTSK